jgi:tetratricopeptide (TPR) repeat protein
MEIEKLIETTSHDILNPLYNFNIAKEYERLNQTASAVSFYLRAAEYGYDTHPLIVYTSLLRMSICFEDQKDRTHTVSNCILQAMGYLPNRPEAYFLMSRFHEKSANWSESYTNADIGLFYSKNKMEPLPADVDYPGEYGLLFEKAVSAWWIGRKDESISIFKDLDNINDQLGPSYRISVTNNLKNLGVIKPN